MYSNVGMNSSFFDKAMIALNSIMLAKKKAYTPEKYVKGCIDTGHLVPGAFQEGKDTINVDLLLNTTTADVSQEQYDHMKSMIPRIWEEQYVTSGRCTNAFLDSINIMRQESARDRDGATVCQQGPILISHESVCREEREIIEERNRRKDPAYVEAQRREKEISKENARIEKEKAVELKKVQDRVDRAAAKMVAAEEKAAAHEAEKARKDSLTKEQKKAEAASKKAAAELKREKKKQSEVDDLARLGVLTSAD
jgi:hypothetical protein